MKRAIAFGMSTTVSSARICSTTSDVVVHGHGLAGAAILQALLAVSREAGLGEQIVDAFLGRAIEDGRDGLGGADG